jgi:transposase-like protein
MSEQTERFETWSRRIAELHESGMTVPEFARKHDLKRGTVSYWKWRIAHPQESQPRRRRSRPRGMGSPLSREPRRSPLSFIEVPTSAAGPVLFELVFADGRRVRIPQGFDATALERLLGVLEARP